MGQRSKGGLWCDRCQRPVLGVKTTHRARNTLSVGGALATGGLSLLGTRVEGYRCPHCGGRARPRNTGIGAGATLVVLLATATLVVCIALWLALAVVVGVSLGVLVPVRLATHKSPSSVEVAMRRALKKVGGWVKALVGAVSYPGATPRAASAAPGIAPEHTKSIPSAPEGVADEISKLASLRDQGALTEEEFAALKAKLLSQDT